jgi:uncharacterized protein (TIGR02996 family)
MTPDDAFLQDIILHPDDDTPRLIYADWLDDHGQADRAEFIRLQCRLARETDQPGADVRAMRLRVDVLLHQHGRDWAGPVLCSLAQGHGFRRGFVYFVSIALEALLGRCGELFEAAPIRHLRLVAPYDRLGELLAAPQLGRLAFLDFGSYRALGDQGLAVVARCPFLRHLEGLLLRGQDITPEGVAALTASPYLHRLRWLDLAGNRLGADGARLLAGWPGLAGLTRLDVSGNWPRCTDGLAPLALRLGWRLVS